MRSGTQYTLESGGYRAHIASVGASLRALTWKGRDLVLPFAADEVAPRYRGAVLAPWPNRIGDGRWTWRGTDQQLPITEPEHHSALHGLALWLDWQAVRATSTAVTLGTRICAQPGYPCTVDLEMTWSLSSQGLSGALVARNVGRDPAPYGCGIHPYLVGRPDTAVDTWILHLPAARRLEVNDQLLPRPPAQSPPPNADFRVARPIGTVAIDHAYGDVEFQDGSATVTLVDAAGDGVALHFTERTPWVQVHTADRADEPTQHRRGLAVEPMTCPPNAFADEAGIDVVAPGASRHVEWRISAV